MSYSNNTNNINPKSCTYDYKFKYIGILKWVLWRINKEETYCPNRSNTKSNVVTQTTTITKKLNFDYKLLFQENTFKLILIS